MMTFYHRTTTEFAAAIIDDGFVDGAIDDMYAEWSVVGHGVWIHDHPVISNRVLGDHVIVFDLAADVSKYRLGAGHPAFAESGWFVPAAILNEAANKRVVLSPGWDEFRQPVNEGDLDND